MRAQHRDVAVDPPLSERNAAGGAFAALGLLGAVLASSCCILPLVLVVLGIGGAWIGTLTALEPYQPYFLATTAVCLGVGYWQV